ncbi:chromate transporter [Paraburkholderia fungorum]|uniref:chromate transporter n=1 Tax=Paraburkholderia fungorum TaxID=134537 RepID=UPI0004854C01|nr:chromate transporter [Paraburkholderia fungorum]MBB5541220.1 chromate transporter [Paraburkholderia fungorum]PNE55089.1 chromate transporter [Paraburkholderia fungorum]
MRDNLYLQLIVVFVPLSLLSLGGGQSIVADINQQAVVIHGWVTQAEFVDMFAISRAAPGPGALLTTLIGWKAAGWPGAAVASLALFVPSSVLAYGATLAWTRHQQHPWHRTAERGLAPVATGLILASAFSVLRSSSATWTVWGLAAIALFLFVARPRMNPLAVLFAAGLVHAGLGAMI